MAELPLAVQQALTRYSSLREAILQSSDLKEAMATRQLIESAKHILMKQLTISEKEAVRQLQRISRDMNQTLKEAAQNITKAYESRTQK